MIPFTDKIKTDLGLSVDSTHDETMLAIYSLFGESYCPPESVCPLVDSEQDIPILTFEGTDGLFYSVAFAHPGLSSVALVCSDALSATKTKIRSMLSKRDLSPAELAIARAMSKALVIDNTYTPKDTVLSISNVINHCFIKYGCVSVSDDAAVLACQVVLATPSMSDATRVFARSHLAKTVTATETVELFVKSRQ